MSDGHERLIGAAIMAGVVGGTVHQHGKTGKWPLAAKAVMAEFVVAFILLVLTIASGFKPGFIMAEFLTVVAFCITLVWLIIHLVRQALKATHPSNFPQFENRPVPELAREMMAKPNMTERFIVLHHDPTKRHIITVPGHPDRICCQADGNWYDWDPYEGCYVFSGI